MRSGDNQYGGDDWTVVIAPDRGRALAAVILTWVVCAVVALLVSNVVGDGMPGYLAWSIVAPFALLVTWSGLRTWLWSAGTITIFRQGFSVSDGKRERLRRTWDQVEGFIVGNAFGSPLHQGRPAPHVRFPDGSVDWLPQNGGLDAGAVVAVMEGARRLAAAGWPQLPRTAQALAEWSQYRPDPDGAN